MLIKCRPGIDQPTLLEARLSKRSIFKRLRRLKMPGHPWPGRETQKISVSLGVLDRLAFDSHRDHKGFTTKGDP
jgi:hypothetical protein